MEIKKFFVNLKGFLTLYLFTISGGYIAMVWLMITSVQQTFMWTRNFGWAWEHLD